MEERGQVGKLHFSSVFLSRVLELQTIFTSLLSLRWMSECNTLRFLWALPSHPGRGRVLHPTIPQIILDGQPGILLSLSFFLSPSLSLSGVWAYSSALSLFSLSLFLADLHEAHTTFPSARAAPLLTSLRRGKGWTKTSSINEDQVLIIPVL